MVRPWWNRPWVLNIAVFWNVVAQAGVYQLQQHDDSDSMWDFKFRIVEGSRWPTPFTARSDCECSRRDFARLETFHWPSLGAHAQAISLTSCGLTLAACWSMRT